MPPSLADRIADMNTVHGFLVPVPGSFQSEPLDGSDPVYELTAEDLRKTQEGYACPRCLADFGAIYRITCPMCLHVRDVERDFVPAPEMWVQHRNDRNNFHGATRARTADEAIAAVMANPDIDHARISQLRPRKWGRGRPA